MKIEPKNQSISRIRLGKVSLGWTRLDYPLLDSTINEIYSAKKLNKIDRPTFAFHSCFEV